MMTVLDGRNPNKVPEIIQISEDTIFEKINDKVFCLIIDNCFVPCVKDHTPYGAYDYILCAAYKTRNGFNKWFERQCK